MSLLGDAANKIAKDTTEIMTFIIICVAGVFVMTLGFFWAGIALFLYAVYRFLPSEKKIIAESEKKMRKNVEEEEKGKNKGDAEEAAREMYRGGAIGAAKNELAAAGFSNKEIADLFKKWREEDEEEKRKEREETRSMAFPSDLRGR